jgi:hypothetical protein
MPRIFEGASASADSAVMDELLYLVKQKGSITEDAAIRYIRQRVAVHAVVRILDVMLESGMIKVASRSKFGVRTFVAGSH